MTSISERLRELGVQVGTRGIPTPRRKTRPEIEDLLDGHWQETPLGRAFVTQKSYPESYIQGEICIQPPAGSRAISRWLENEAVRKLPLSAYAFIDTETTGLSGGAGTYTFLIGVGRFIDKKFQISQFFMRDPGEETAQLSALESYLAPTSVFVSYNGKSFDLPILTTRFLQHGLRPSFADHSHIDLLHLSRRVWKYQLSKHNLGKIEGAILNFTRSEEDIPGWQIPELFFNYMRSGDPAPLKKVFYHNEMDVLSLAALLNRLCLAFNEPREEQLLTRKGSEMLGVAKHFHDLKEWDQAVNAYTHSLEQDDLREADYWEGVKGLSMVHKKRGEWDRAADLWKNAADHGEHYAFIELAKLYEHRKKDYNEALHWSLSAREIFLESPLPDYLRQQLLREINHRIERLKTKILRRNSSKKNKKRGSS